MARRFNIDDPFCPTGEVVIRDGEELAVAFERHHNNGELLGPDEDWPDGWFEDYIRVARLKPGQMVTTGVIRWLRLPDGPRERE